MDRIKKKLGFGMMRLPMNGEDIDIDQTKKMVDAFMAAGFNYFDTAHGYINEKSERAVKEALTSRYPREAYVLTDKLSSNYFNKEEDIEPMLDTQLAWCGVSYFDFYLMHAQGRNNYQHYLDCHAYEVAKKMKEKGKIRHIGISFHDSAEFLDKILTEHPEIEIVQLQFNYLDEDDPNVQSLACYKVAEKHGLPVIVMEPVKGGRLAKVSAPVASLFKSLSSASPASFAIRYAASFPNVKMVLSGMSDASQMEDNIATMKDFIPLSAKEQAVVAKARSYLRTEGLIECTHCEYCEAVCPVKMPIPDIFAALSEERSGGKKIDVSLSEKSAECLACGACESMCPQHLPIRDLLTKANR